MAHQRHREPQRPDPSDGEARSHFPNEQAALKGLLLNVMTLDPIGDGRHRWTKCWKAALNAVTIAFERRMISSGK